MGIAPLPTIIKRWTDRQYEASWATAACRTPTARTILGPAILSIVASDDGTIGETGVVTELLEKRLGDYQPDIVRPAGRRPCWQALKKVVDDFGLPCQVSYGTADVLRLRRLRHLRLWHTHAGGAGLQARVRGRAGIRYP